MKHLQTYGLFESKQTLTEEQKNFLDKSCSRGFWSLNPETGLVDTKGNFTWVYKIPKLKNFRGIQFGEVRGVFHCQENAIETLEGGPRIVGEDFACYDNKLTTLKGAPEIVKGDFSCYDNNLTTLEGSPRTVWGNFYCTDNPLETLAGAPETIDGQFMCSEFICQWNLEGKLRVLRTGKPAARSLIATALPSEDLQQWIDSNPSGAAVDLKRIWKTLKSDPKYADLKFPEGHSKEMDLLSDLADVGL